MDTPLPNITGSREVFHGISLRQDNWQRKCKVGVLDLLWAYATCT
jgi:hypothetical protein